MTISTSVRCASSDASGLNSRLSQICIRELFIQFGLGKPGGAIRPLRKVNLLNSFGVSPVWHSDCDY
jgi:hypothetical protein